MFVNKIRICILKNWLYSTKCNIKKTTTQNKIKIQIEQTTTITNYM